MATVLDQLVTLLALERIEENLFRGQSQDLGWARVYGAEFLAAHKGALWYLTKYFTPHPPGEPHFFVKPLAFTRTAAGEAAVIESPGEGPGAVPLVPGQCYKFAVTTTAFASGQVVLVWE